MPGPVVQLSDPWSWVPDWLKPQGASVTDPAWVPPVRYTFNKAADVVHALGLDDPQQQVLGLMGAMTAPGGEASTASAVLDAAAEKFPRLAKVIKAFHGSPHDFEAFDISKIGTGEGAQAYGRGLYVAENPKVAEGYQKQLSGRVPEGWSQKYPDSARGYIRGVVGDVAAGKLTPEQAAKYVSNANAVMRSYPTDQLTAEIADAARYSKGRMYEVAIHADPEHFLDWDKPLSQQPQNVQDAIRSMVPDRTLQMRHATTDPDVGAILERLRQEGDPEEVLKAHGVPGIRYLDQQSRGKTDIAFVQEEIKKTQAYVDRLSAIYEKNPGDSRLLDAAKDSLEFHKQILAEGLKEPPATRNYVVFDDKLISILKKYGIAAPAIEILRRKSQDQGGKLSESDLQGLY